MMRLLIVIELGEATVMARLMVLACTFGLILGTPLSFDAAAAAKKAGACVATGMDGKKATWRCKATQKCCFNWISNKGGCIAASDICL
jgi:hypothetical protein